LEPPNVFGAPQWSNYQARVLCAVISNRTLQISGNQREQPSFPLTDYQYQTSASSADRAVTERAPAARELQTFRKLSTEFFATEIPRDYVAELFFFILISGIATWPIISSMVAITRLVRNY
jgi:hypothetical protein